MRNTKTPSVMPQDQSVTMFANAAFYPVLYRNLLGLPPLKWWQRLYIWLRWGRKVKKACFIAARGTSKTRLTCKMMLGVDPMETEDENAEEET